MSDLLYDVFNTSWGWMGAIGSGRGIRYASLPEASPIDVVEYLEACSKKPLPEHVPGAFEAYRQQLEAYFADELVAWDVALDLEGATEFYARAWEACRAIPPGETRTYAWPARRREGGRTGDGPQQGTHHHPMPSRDRERRRSPRIRRPGVAHEGTALAARSPLGDRDGGLERYGVSASEHLGQPRG